MELKDGHEKVQYGNYYFRFDHLADTADKTIWQGQLNKDGKFTASFSLNDWINAGVPVSVSLYATEQDMIDDKNAVAAGKFIPAKNASDITTVIFEEIESYNDSPSELIYDDFESLVFNGHPLAMPILGTRKTLRHISSKPDYALHWMRKHYSPERMVVFCQGNIRPERFFRLAEKEFGRLQNTPTSLPSRQSPDGQPTVNYTVSRTSTYTRNTHQIHAMLGGRAYPLGHEKQLTLFLLNNILGGGSLNSRLNLSLREKRGLVYTIESTYTPLSDSGYWCAYWACDPEQYDYCLGLIRDELHKLCSTPLSKSGLQKAIQQLRGQMAISAQNQENSALSMAKSMLYYGHVPHWTDTFKKIESISTSQLQNVANETYSPEKLYTLTYK